VEAEALTIWSPQIFETNTFDVISRGDVADRAQMPVRREQKLQAINPLGGCHGYEFSADFPGLRSIFHSRVRYDLGLLVCGAATGSRRPSRVKNGQVASSMSEQVRRRLTRSELFEFASKKSRGFLRGFSHVRLCRLPQ
jgi:hypothetical protein